MTSSLKISQDILEKVANTIRFVSVDAVNRANSGHPGMPMGVAEIGAVLWLKHLNFDPSNTSWLGRDRFVLSNGHGSMFLYSMLHLAGKDLSLEDLKNFRQHKSLTPGHPESFETPGVECTTGPLGQGISNAVGMAIAGMHLGSNYGEEIFNNQIYCMLGDGCLMEGISSEACSLAGHLGLGNLNVIYDDNDISIAGSTELSFSEDVAKRYESYGWGVKKINGHDFNEIDEALSWAKADTSRPSLILAKTIIGKGSPNKQGSSGVHGSPLGEDEAKLSKKEMNWPEEEFYVPGDVTEIFKSRKNELKEVVKSWDQKYEAFKKKNPEKEKELTQRFEGIIPENIGHKLLEALPNPPEKIATRKLSSMVIQKASSLLPSMIGGSADLEPSCLTTILSSGSMQKSDFGARNIHFGVREHSMGAILNGLTYFGGFIPFGSTFMCFADYMKPSIRLAALSNLRSIFVFTHDSIFLGEDGPTHQPVEHLASLRIIPNLAVLRPADADETAMCYALALRNTKGPSAICLTRQSLPPIERAEDFDPEEILLGGYSVFQTEGTTIPELVFVASGSEVSLAIESAKKLASSGLAPSIRVVSMPCWERFNECSIDYKNELIPRSSKTVVIEAGTSFGWAGMINADPDESLNISVESFGISAPLADIQNKFGFTVDKVFEKVSSWL